MNRKLLASLILLTALIIFTAGCKPKGISKSKNYKLANEIVKNDIKFKYFTSKAKVTIPLNKINVSAPVEIRIKKDSTIWLLVKMPMIGLEMMRGMITQDSVFILNKQQKSFSKYSIEEYSKQFGSDLNYSTMEALIMGDVPLKQLENVKLSSTKENIKLTQEISGVTVENLISKKLERLIELTLKSAENGTVVSTYSDFSDLDEQQFAKEVSIWFTSTEDKKIELKLKHGRIKKSNTPLNFPFKISKKYERK